MLQFLRSLSRQSNPSTLTAGLLPKFALKHPPFLEAEVGEALTRPGDLSIGEDAIGEIGGISSFSSLNLASCTNGLETLLGGDPQKNGGDEGTCALNLSAPSPPLLRMMSKSSDPAIASESSA